MFVLLEHLTDPKDAVTTLMSLLNRENGILIANYDIDTIEKDHIGKLTQEEFEFFLRRNFCIVSKIKFEIGSLVYVVASKEASYKAPVL